MMSNTSAAKQEIISLVAAIYGENVSTAFRAKYENELIPTFVHYTYTMLKLNLGQIKAGDELDKILSKYGISVSSYD